MFFCKFHLDCTVFFISLQAGPAKDDQSPKIDKKKKSLKKEEPKLEIRARSGTWSSQSSNKEKDKDVVLRKTLTRGDKEVRRSSDDRRQKRGKCSQHVGDTICTTLTLDTSGIGPA